MTTSDITLALPDKTKVNTLAITANPQVYNELIQRIVCLLFCSDPGIKINDQTVYQLLQTIGSMPESAANSSLSVVADNIRSKLNSEEYCIDSLEIRVSHEGSQTLVTFNVTPAATDKPITEVFIYE